MPEQRRATLSGDLRKGQRKALRSALMYARLERAIG